MQFTIRFIDAESVTLGIDQTWIWVRLEQDLNVTTLEAQEKMQRGSTHMITYALWLASESTTPYNIWVKTIDEIDAVDDVDPKAHTPEEASKGN